MIDNFEAKIQAIKSMSEFYDLDRALTENGRTYAKIALEFVRAFKFMHSLFALDVTINIGDIYFERYKNGQGIVMGYVRESGHYSHCIMPDVKEPQFYINDSCTLTVLPEDILNVLTNIPENILRFLVSREYEQHADIIISKQQEIVRMKRYMSELEHRFNEANAEEQIQIMNQLDQMSDLVRAAKRIELNIKLDGRFRKINQNWDIGSESESYYMDENVYDMDRFPDFY